MDEQVQNVLETIYQTTNENERSKLYNMLNVAMVIHGIRPGCLVMGISEGNNILEELESIGCMGAYILTARSRTESSIHLCVVRADDEERVALLESIVTQDNRILHPEPIDIFEINTTHAFSRDERDKDIGFLLGYFNPIALRNALRYNKSVRIKVIVRKNGEQFTLTMFPQRVGSLSVSQKEQLINMADATRRLELPLGVTILSAQAIVESDGIQNVLQNAHRQNGGKRNKATRKRVRRARRSHRRVKN